MLIASPHPLDFDWRFDASTTERLSQLLRNRKVLAVGVPSVARLLEAHGGSVLLIDRQPLQGVRNHLVSDISALTVANADFDAAIVDSPWYPQHLTTWTMTAARIVGPGREVFVSVWPTETRPGAAQELADAVALFETWAEIDALPFELRYNAPPFELIAHTISGESPLARSPRRGRLLRLRVRRIPDLSAAPPAASAWYRFSIDRYQLAVRLGAGFAAEHLIVSHPECKNWLWPYVSARAPGLDRIGIWSSSNEAAQVSDPCRLISILRQALKATDIASFEEALCAAPQLMEWQLPRPPFERILEWQHP